MNEKVSDSIKFLLNQYKRLIKKKQNSKLNNSEKQTLESLKKFLGKNK
tara:strand:- start:1079 stop:1222 length:144 start_codon:yes stop_codon:yes gene_type:complete